jgi:hypothetical protein
MGKGQAKSLELLNSLKPLLIGGNDGAWNEGQGTRASFKSFNGNAIKEGEILIDIYLAILIAGIQRKSQTMVKRLYLNISLGGLGIYI